VLLLLVPFTPPARQIPRFVRGALVPVLRLRAIVPPEALLQNGVKRGTACRVPTPFLGNEKLTGANSHKLSG
jgi:hypothetical protein